MGRFFFGTRYSIVGKGGGRRGQIAPANSLGAKNGERDLGGKRREDLLNILSGSLAGQAAEWKEETLLRCTVFCCSPFSGSSCGRHSAISPMICLSSLVSFSMETFSSALKSGFMDLHSTIWDSTDPMPFAEGPLSEK